MFSITSYDESNEKIWDDFVMNKSINGTFLQTRKFLNYHPKERFQDSSLMVYNEKNNLCALVLGCRIERDGIKNFISHQGTTFGGIIVDQKHYRAKYLVPMVEEIKQYLSERYDYVKFKCTSDIFSKSSTALMEYVLKYSGFEEYKELSTYIDFSSYKEDILSNFSQGKRTNVHNCEKAKLELRELNSLNEIKEFYSILEENLSKHNTKPVHTIDELLDLKDNRIQDEIGFYGVFDKDLMIAGSMMFYFKNVNIAHTQYLASKQDYNRLSPMTYMYYCMIKEMKEKGYSKISWGTATEDMGKILNMGLITSKEDFGSTYCNNVTYVMSFNK